MIENGIISTYKNDRGFGFIWCEAKKLEFFFRVHDCRIDGNPRVGDRVSFRVEPGRDGRPQATKVCISEAEKNNAPAHIGMTSDFGSRGAVENGWVRTSADDDGALLHIDNLKDGGKIIKPSHLYAFDKVKQKNTMLCLNAYEIRPDQETVLRGLVANERLDGMIRLKASEWLATLEGRQAEFKAKLNEAILLAEAKKSVAIARDNAEWGIDNFVKSPGESFGTPGHNTVTTVQAVSIAGLTLAGIVGVAGAIFFAKEK